MLLSISLFIVSGYGTGEGLEKQWRSGETGFHCINAVGVACVMSQHEGALTMWVWLVLCHNIGCINDVGVACVMSQHRVH